MSTIQEESEQLKDRQRALILDLDVPIITEAREIAIMGQIAAIDNRLASLNTQLGMFSPPFPVVYPYSLRWYPFDEHIIIFSAGLPFDFALFIPRKVAREKVRKGRETTGSPFWLLSSSSSLPKLPFTQRSPSSSGTSGSFCSSSFSLFFASTICTLPSRLSWFGNDKPKKQWSSSTFNSMMKFRWIPTFPIICHHTPIVQYPSSSSFPSVRLLWDRIMTIFNSNIALQYILMAIWWIILAQ